MCHSSKLLKKKIDNWVHQVLNTTWVCIVIDLDTCHSEKSAKCELCFTTV